jgi:hypothetical protein
MSNQITRLTRPFPKSMIQEKPGGFAAKYVAHARVVEKLIAVLGPFDYEVTQLIKDPDGTVTGCVSKLTVEIDGKLVTVSEIGDVENPGTKNNGARAKDASSDAIKRCAMRLGVGLELWVKGEPMLHAALVKAEDIEAPKTNDEGEIE